MRKVFNFATIISLAALAVFFQGCKKTEKKYSLQTYAAQYSNIVIDKNFGNITVTSYAKQNNKTISLKEYKAKGGTIYFKYTSFKDNGEVLEVINEYYKVYADDTVYFYDNSPNGWVRSSIDILNDYGDPLAEVSRVISDIRNNESKIVQNGNNYSCAELKTGEVFIPVTNFFAVTNQNKMNLKYHFTYDYDVTIQFGNANLTAPI